MSIWIHTRERLPKPGEEALINRPEWKEPRTGYLCLDAPLAQWRLTDCTHPMQNAVAPLEDSQWLDS